MIDPNGKAYFMPSENLGCFIEEKEYWLPLCSNFPRTSDYSPEDQVFDEVIWIGPSWLMRW